MASTSVYAAPAMMNDNNNKPYDDLMTAEDFESPSYYKPISQSNYDSYRSENGANSRRMANNTPTRKSKRVTFFKNGDRYFTGKTVNIGPNRSLKELMSDLNRSVDLPYGVRRIYTPVNGTEVYNIDELNDGSNYVCASFEPFRPTKYGDWSEKPWNANISK